MKRLVTILSFVVVLIAFSGGDLMAQNFYSKQKSILKDRKELNKERDKFNKTRVSKENKKLAKQMEKEGWKVNGGNPSLAYQLQVKDDYNTSLFRDEENNRIYITGSGDGTAKTRIKANLVAEQMAQRNLLQQIKTQLGSLEKGYLVNDDMELDLTTKKLVEGVLKRSEVIYNVYIKNPDGTFTVNQEWAIDARVLDKEAEELYNKQKKEELKEQQKELDGLTDF